MQCPHFQMGRQTERQRALNVVSWLENETSETQRSLAQCSGPLLQSAPPPILAFDPRPYLTPHGPSPERVSPLRPFLPPGGVGEPPEPGSWSPQTKPEGGGP